jgi:hypothetical protein
MEPVGDVIGWQVHELITSQMGYATHAISLSQEHFIAKAEGMLISDALSERHAKVDQLLAVMDHKDQVK